MADLGVLVHQPVLGIHLHMVFLESLLVFIFFFCHLYRNARENQDHVMHLSLVHLADDRLSTSYLTSLISLIIISVSVHWTE